MLRGILCLTAVAALMTSVIAHAADWPQFMGPDRNGVVGNLKLSRTWPANGPKELWTTQVGAGFGAPAVVGDQVFLLDRVGNEKDAVRCLSLADGKELWRFEYDAPGKLDYNGSRAVPAVDKDHVYTVGPFGHVYAIDRKTRKPVWNFLLSEQFGGKLPRWGYSQSPLLYKQWILIAPQTDAGVVALNRKDGKVAWKSPNIGSGSYCSPSITRMDQRDVILMVTSNKVVGLNADDGSILWSYTGWKCAIPIAPPLPVGDNRFFITGGYNAGSVLIQINEKEGKLEATELFKIRRMGSQIHYALFIKDHIYLNTKTNEGDQGLVCLDLTGKVMWQTERNPSFERGNLLQVGDLILGMHGEKGELVLIEPNSEAYKELARAKVLDGGTMWAPLTIANGKLLLRDQRQLKCLDIQPAP